MPSIVNQFGVEVLPVVPEPAAPRRVRCRAARQRYRIWLKRVRTENLSATALAQRLGRPARTVAAGVRWAVLDEEERRARPIVWPHASRDASGGLTRDDIIMLVETYGPETDLGSEPYFREYLTPLVKRIVRRYPTLTGLREWLDAVAVAVPEPVAVSAA